MGATALPPTPAPRKSQFRIPNCTRAIPAPAVKKEKSIRKKEPRTLVRIVGQAPLAATVYELDRLRLQPVRRSVFHRTGTRKASARKKYDETTPQR